MSGFNFLLLVPAKDGNGVVEEREHEHDDQDGHWEVEYNHSCGDDGVHEPVVALEYSNAALGKEERVEDNQHQC